MEENRRKLIGSIIGLIVFILCIASLTFAYFSWRSANKIVDVGIHDGGIKYVYSNTNNILSSDSLAPVTTYNTLSNSLLYTDYTATNTTARDAYEMKAILHINSISNSLKSNAFKWVLLEDTGSGYTNIIKQGNFANAVVGNNTIDLNVYLIPGENKNYRFVMYIDGNVQNNPTSGSIDAELELCDELIQIMPITLDNNGADTGQEGTATIYLKYGVGVFKDSTAYTTQMKTDANPITSPTKTGRTFLGYYDEENTYATTDGRCNNGQRLIDGVEKPYGVTDNVNNGHITSFFYSRPTYFNDAATIYACYKMHTYNVTIVDNGGTATRSKENPIQYDYERSNEEDLYVNVSKTITFKGNPNSTSGANAESGTVTIGANTIKTQTFAGWTGTNINTSTAKYGNANNPTTAWTNGTTKTTPYAKTYFRNLASTNGTTTVTLTANWTPVGSQLPTITKQDHTCGWGELDDSEATEIVYPTGASYTPTATAAQTLNFYGVCFRNNFVNTTTNKYYEYLSQALSEVNSNQTIKAQFDFEPASGDIANPTLASGKTGVTIDLNGKNISIGNKVLSNSGSLTIISGATGGTLSGTGDSVINNGTGTLTVTSGTISGTQRGVSTTTGPITVNGGTIRSTATSGNYDGIYKDGSTGTVSISSGSVTGYRAGIYNNVAGTINISGGTITGTTNGIYNKTTGTINITGGSVTGNTGITNAGAGTITVNGTGVSVTGSTGIGIVGLTGNITVTKGEVKGATHGITSTTGSVTVNGGTVRSTATSGNNDGINKSGTGTISVSSGSVIGYRAGIYNSSTGATNITGGSVTGGVGIQNTGASPITINGNGASVTGTSGNGITGASGNIIVTNGSVTGATTGINSTTGNITINGGTVTGNGISGTTGGIYKNGATGTIEVSSGTVSGYYGIYNNAASPINITGGTVSGTGMNGIYNKTTATVTVTGGTVSGVSHGIHMNGAGTLTMGESGGTPSTTTPVIQTIGTTNTYGVYIGNASSTYNFYDGKVTSASGEGKSIYLPNNFLIKVPEGYDVVKTTTNGIETAILQEANNYQNMTTNKKYIYLYRAMSEVETGQTIKVLANTTETTSVTVATDKNVTIDLNGKTVDTTGMTITNNGTLTITSGATGGTLSGTTNNFINTGASNITISGGTVTAPQTVINATTGTVTINGGHVTSTATSGNYDGIYKNGTTGTVTVSSGSVTGFRAGIYNNNTSNVTVSGGTVTGTTQAIYNASTGTIAVSGGTVTGTTQAIYNNSTGTINITGGTTTGNNGIVNKTTGPIIVNGANAKVTGTAGNGIVGVTGNVTVTNGEVKGSTNGITSTTGNVTVNGGTVTTTATSGTNAAINKNGATGTVTVSSGTVSGYYGIYNNAASPINITGGTVTGTGMNGIYNKTTATITVTGGTVSGLSHGIHMFGAGTLTMGESGGTPSTTTPTIKTTGTSNMYGVYIANASGTYNFYDGRVMSDSGTGKSIYLPNNFLITVPDGYDVVKTTSGVTETAILQEANNYQNMTTNKKYIYLYRAMSEASTGQTIKVLSNTTETTSVIVASGKTVTIDLNGKTVDTTGVTITNNGTLTITSSASGGTLSGTTNNFINTGASNLTVSGGTVTAPQTVITVTTGDVIISGGHVTSTATSGNYDGIYKNGSTGALTVSSGSVTGYRSGIYNNVAASINISGGTVTGTTQGIYNNSTGAISVTGGTVTGNNGIVNKAAAPITVNGNNAKVIGTAGIGITGLTGDVTLTTGEVKGSTHAISSTTGDVMINGGTVTSTATTGNNDGISKSSTGTISITGGTVTGYRAGIYNGAAGTVNVTGGTVTGNNGIQNAGSGTITINGTSVNVSGTAGSGIVGQTGSVTITTGTITATGSGITSTTGTVTVNGGTISSTVASGTNSGIYKNGASGLVTVNSGTVSGYYGIYNNLAGPISITGGTVTGTDMNGIYNKTTGTITVTGGTVQGTTHGIHMNGAGTLTMGESGGTPSTTTPTIKTIGTTDKYGVYVQAAGATYNFYDGRVQSASGTGKSIYTPNNFLINVPDNYDIVKTTTSGTETAILVEATNYQNMTTNKKYIYLYRAINEAESGQTIKVLANTTETTPVTVASGKTTTIDLNGKTVTLNGANIVNNGSLTISSGATGGKISGNGDNVINNGTGTLTISSGTVEGTKTVITSTTGDVTINGGTVTSTATTGNYDGIYKNGATGTVIVSSGSVTGYRAGIYNNAASIVTVSGGTVTGTTTGIHNNSTGNINVSNGTVTGTTQGIYNSSTGTVAVSGGTVTGTTQGIYNNSTGTININGGTTTGSNGIVNKAAGPITVNGANAKVTGTAGNGITGVTGAITVTNGEVKGSTNGINSTTGTVTVNGGTVTSTATSGTNAAIYKNGASGLVTISSGTVSGYYGIYNNIAGPISVIGGTVTGTGMNGIYNKTTGSITVTDGTVQGLSHGVHLAGAGTLTMGDNSGTPSTTTPTIKTTGTNNVYGVYVGNASATYNFYDGKVQSSSGTGKSIYTPNNFLINVPEGYDVVKTTTNGIETAILSAANSYQNMTTNKRYIYLYRALAEAATGQTIRVLANTTETTSATLAADKTVTLDLYGKTITTTGVTITNNGTLTIASSQSGGSITGDTNNFINTGASNLTVTGGTITTTQTVINATTGSVTISGGNIISTATTGTYDGIYKNGTSGTVTVSSGSVTGYRAGIYNNAASNVTVSGGTVTGTTTGIHNNSTGNINVSNGTVTGTTQGIYNSSTGTVAVSGGTVTGTTQAIYNNSTGPINITGGTTIGNNGIVNKAAGPITVNGANAKVTGTAGNGITGVTGAITVTTGEVKGSTNGINSTTGTVTVNGGTVTTTATSGTNAAIYKNGASGLVTVSSGTVSGYYGIYNNVSGPISITGGTVTGTGMNGIYNKAAGTITITGGTVQGESHGIHLTIASTFTMGESGGTPSTTTPTIKTTGTSDTYGVYIANASATYNFYDGRVMSDSGTGKSIYIPNNFLITVPEGYDVVKTTSGVTETAVLGTANNYQNMTTNKKYMYLNRAMNEVETGQTIKALANTSENASVTVATDKNVTIDLNGKTITTTGVTITNNGTLTITSSTSGGTISGTTNNFINTGASNLTISGGTVTAPQTVINATTGSVTISGGNVTSTATTGNFDGIYKNGTSGTVTVSSGSVTGYRAGIYNNTASNVTISGGSVTGTTQAIYNGSTGTIAVSNGTITGTTQAINNNSTGAINITGGTTTGNNGIVNKAAAPITVNGTNAKVIGTAGIGITGLTGDVTVTKGEVKGSTHAISSTTGDVTINGGTVTSTATSGNNDGINKSNTGTISVTSGTVTGYRAGIYNGAAGTVNVTGGTVTGNNGIQNNGAGTITINGTSVNVSGTAGSGIVGQTGSVTITTGTITATGSGITSTTGTVTVNGGTISSTVASGTNSGIYKNGGSGLVTVNSGTVSGYYGIYNNAAGPISVTGGTVTGTDMNGIYNKTTGTITVTGGTVQGTTHGIHLVGVGSLTMGENGGTPSTTTPLIKTIGTTNAYGVYVQVAGATYNFYDGKVTSASGEGKSIYTPNATYIINVPDNYDIVKTTSSGTETAILGTANNYQNMSTNKKYIYLNRALAEVTTGQTIKVLSNTTETTLATLAADKTATLDLNGKTVTLTGTNIVNNGTLTISSGVAGGKISGDADTVINNGTGTLTVSSGTVEGTKTVITSTTGPITINGGVISSSATTGNYDGIYKNGATGTVTVSSGSVTGYRAGIYNNSTSQVTVSGGIVTGTAQGIYNNSTGTISITGGTTTGNNGIVNKVAGIITVNGANAQVTGLTAIGINSLTGDLTITNGTVTGATQGISSTTGTVTVNGGTVTTTATSGTNAAIYKNGATGTVTVNSGTVTGYYGIYNNVAGLISVTGGSVTGTTMNGIYNKTTGTITVTGGTVQGTSHGIQLAGAGTLTMGENSGTPSTTTPLVKTVGTSNTYGVYIGNASAIYNFYDGKVVSSSGRGFSIKEPNTTYTINTPTNYGVAKTTTGNTESAFLAITHTITLTKGSGVDTIAGTGWTGSPGATITKSIAEGTQLVMSDITVTPLSGFTGASWTKTSGSGSLNDGIFTVSTGNATLTVTSGIAPDNKVNIYLKKDGSNCSSCGGYTVHLSTSQTVDTASFTGTTASSNKLQIVDAIEPGVMYYVWVARDANHKVAGTNNTNMVYSGVSFTGSNLADLTTTPVNFYTLKMVGENVNTLKLNNTQVTSGNSVVVVGGAPQAITGTVDTGYVFTTWSTTSGTATYDNASSISTYVTVSASSTIKATASVSSSNRVTITINKEDAACTTCNGYAVHISTSNTTDTATFTSTTPTSSQLIITNAFVPGQMYYIWVGEDYNHKTTTLKYSGVSFTGGVSATATINFYTITSTCNHGEIKFNNETICSMGNGAFSTDLEVLGSTSPIHSISAIPINGYAFAGWTSSNSNTTITSASNATTTLSKTAASATITASFIPDPNNKVHLSLKKDGANCTTCNGYAVHISTSSTTDSATFTDTTTTSNQLTMTKAMLPGVTYYVWIARDANHKTAGTSNANMVYSGVSFEAGPNVTPANPINFYTLTMTGTNVGTLKLNGTTVTSGNSVVVVGGAPQGITGTVSNGYKFSEWTTTSGAASFENSSIISTNTTVGAASTINAAATPYNYQNTSTNTYYDYLDDALNAVASNQTIKVLNNTTESEDATLASGKTGVTLNLNDKIITYDYGYGIKNNGTLTISSTSSNGKITSLYNVILNNGTLNVPSGTIESSYEGFAINNNSTGTVSISGGQIIGALVGIVNSSTGTINVSGGLVSGVYGIKNTSTGPINITGGYIEGVNAAIANESSGAITVNGTNAIINGTSLDNNQSGYGIVGLSGAVTVTKGEVSGSKTGITSTTGTVTVNGGTVRATGSQNVWFGIEKTGAGNINVSSGTVDGAECGIALAPTASGETGTINITGGTVKGDAGVCATENAINININGANASIIGEGGLPGIYITTSNPTNIDVTNGSITGATQGIYSQNSINITVKGGTISGAAHGIQMAGGGTLTMGENSGTPSTTNPVISTTGTSNKYGVYIANSSTTYNFYDGKVTSASGTGKSIYTPNGFTINIPNGYTISKTTTNGTETAILQLNTFPITLDNQGATSAGTPEIYMRYSDGLYLTNNNGTYTNKMSTTQNPINPPAKTGYGFNGYYLNTNYVNNQQMLTNEGKLTSYFSNTQHNAPTTWYAKWTPYTYPVTLNKGTCVTNGTTSVTATYDSTAITPSSITMAYTKYTISGFGLDSSRKSNGAIVSSTNDIESIVTTDGYYTASGGTTKVLTGTTAEWAASVSGWTDENKKWKKASDATVYAKCGAHSEKTLPTITKTGYTCGWTTSSTGTTITYASGASITPTSNQTLYGVCVPNTYNIEYNLNGGSHGTNHPTSGTYDETVNLSNPTRTGYTFSGWTASGLSVGSAQTKVDNSSSTSWTNWNGTTATTNQYFRNLTAESGGTVTLTAIWLGDSHFVNYEGIGAMYTDYYYEFDALHNNDSITTHNKTASNPWVSHRGMTRGTISNATWGDDRIYFNGTSAGVLTETKFTSTYATMTVSAEFMVTEVPSTTQYIVTNLQSGGFALLAGSSGKGCFMLHNGTEYKSVCTTSALSANKKYHLVGTYDGTTMNLYLNGSLNNSITTSGTIKAPTNDTVVAAGCNPLGSACDSEYFKGYIYSFGYALGDAVNRAASAIQNDAGKTVTYGATYGTLPTPVKAGYTFDGWYKNISVDSSTGAITFSNNVTASSTVSTDADHTLYAKWKNPITYNISYNLDGGTHGSSHPTSATYGNVVTISNPTKVGYTFAGWTATGLNSNYTTARSGTSSSSVFTSWSGTARTHQYYKNLTSASGGTVTLTATWTRNFTCPSANGNTVSYYGRTWKRISIDTTNKTCELVMVAQTASPTTAYTTATGAYTSATNNIKTELRGNSVFAAEDDAGFIKSVDTNITSDSASGVYWIASGKIYDSNTHKGKKNDGTLYLWRGGCSDANGSHTCMMEDRLSEYSYASCLDDPNNNLAAGTRTGIATNATSYSAIEGTCTAHSLTLYQSKSWTLYETLTWNSASSFKAGRVVSGEFSDSTNPVQGKIKIYQCGGEHHNEFQYSLTAITGTKIRWKNESSGATADRSPNSDAVALFAGAAASTTTSDATNGVVRTYNHATSTVSGAECKNDFKYYTANNSNVSYPIHYRPHIVVSYQ